MGELLPPHKQIIIMKKIMLAITMMASALTTFAQNSAIHKVEFMVEKERYEEALQIIETALANPKTTKFAGFYYNKGEVNRKYFERVLDMASQGYPFDTLAFCTYLDEAVTNFTKSHLADMQPDKKGRVEPQYKEKNYQTLKTMVNYYNYAGVFANQMGDYQKSIEWFRKYYEFPKNPVFSASETDSLYAINPVNYGQTAVNIVMLNFQLKNWDGILETVDAALKDTFSTRDLYLMKMQAHLEKNDSAAYINDLKEAIARTEHVGFAQNLLYVYMQRNQPEEAMALANELVASNPSSHTGYYLKGCIELNMLKNYVAARESFGKAIELNPSFVDANVNMAYTYMNEVVARRNNGDWKLDRNNKKEFDREFEEIKKYYEQALPFMERAHELVPDQPKVWAAALQQIYTNLQNKQKADEMDAILSTAY